MEGLPEKLEKKKKHINYLIVCMLAGLPVLYLLIASIAVSGMSFRVVIFGFIVAFFASVAVHSVSVLVAKEK